MAIEVRRFSVTTPAGTLSTAPQTASLQVPPRELRRIEFKVPPGPRGVLGFAIGMAGRHLFPYGDTAWLVTDDEENGWDVQGQPNSGAWQCYSYNSGQYDHTIEIRLLLDLPANPLEAASGPLDPLLLGPPPTA